MARSTLGADEAAHLVHAVGDAGGEVVLVLPLEAGGQQLGRLVLGPRRGSLEYTAQDQARLAATVALVADAPCTAHAPTPGRLVFTQ